MMTVKSDDFKSKRDVVMSIIEDGKANLPEYTGTTSRTNQLFYTLMTGSGLYVSH
jgi:hypothetical protein